MTIKPKKKLAKKKSIKRSNPDIVKFSKVTNYSLNLEEEASRLYNKLYDIQYSRQGDDIEKNKQNVLKELLYCMAKIKNSQVEMRTLIDLLKD